MAVDLRDLMDVMKEVFLACWNFYLLVLPKKTLFIGLTHFSQLQISTQLEEEHKVTS